MLHKITVSFTLLLVAFSGIAELLFPSKMLTFVSISSNQETEFLLQTTAVALISFLPSIWSARNEANSLAKQNALLGIAIYMFLSSFVDYQAFTKEIVNQMSVPSIVFRSLLGITLLYLSFSRKVSK